MSAVVWVGLSILILCAVVIIFTVICYAIYVPGNKRTIFWTSALQETMTKKGYRADFWGPKSSQYADLPYGRTHYYLLGPANGDKVVFIHGISSPSVCFAESIDTLVAHGYRVLVYDLWGRGFSDTPGSVEYTEDLYNTQLALLLDHLNWSHFKIVGLSLGGAIAVSFTHQYPHMVDKICLIAPAGLLERLPIAAYVLSIPYLGPTIVHTFGRNFLHKIYTKSYTLRKPVNRELVHALKYSHVHLDYHPGFLRAYYSTIMHFPLQGLASKYMALEQSHSKRVGVVWGDQDKVVDYALHLKLQRLIPSADIITIPGATHSLLAEEPKITMKAVASLLG